MNEAVLVALNFVSCLAGAWVCLCRMGQMSGSATKLSIRVQYAITFAIFAASAISWTYNDPASVTQFAMTTAMLAHLLIGTEAWRYGPPDYTMRHQGGD